MNTLICIGCKSEKGETAFTFLTLTGTSKEIEVCNKCFKIFEPIWAEIRELGKDPEHKDWVNKFMTGLQS